jgi:hypothetical protein
MGLWGKKREPEKLPGETRRTIRKGSLPHTGDGVTQAKGKIPAKAVEFKSGRAQVKSNVSRLRAIADGTPHDGKHRRD